MATRRWHVVWALVVGACFCGHEEGAPLGAVALAGETKSAQADGADATSVKEDVPPKRDIRFFFRGGTGNTAMIDVEKWLDKKWVSKRFFVKKGQKIGSVSTVRGSDRKRLSVDFSTGYVLIDVLEARRKVSQTKSQIVLDPETHRPVRNPNGTLKMREVQVERTTASMKIVVESEEHGRRQLWLEKTPRR